MSSMPLASPMPVDRSTGRPFRYSLRALLAGFAVLAVGLWLAVDRVHRQRDAVQHILASYGYVTYDETHASPVPAWLSDYLGIDFVYDVAAVELFADVDIGFLPDLPNVRYLNLGSHRVTDEALRRMPPLERLEELHIWSDQTTDRGLAWLAGQTKLRKLSLVADKVTDAGMPALRDLPRLEELDLACTSVSDAGVPELAKLPGLRRLALPPHVTDKSVPVLAGMTQLRRLDLAAARISDEAVADLKQALPRCAVIR